VAGFYTEVDAELPEVGSGNILLDQHPASFLSILQDVLWDVAFWKYLGFALITIGMKLAFVIMALMVPKMLQI